METMRYETAVEALKVIAIKEKQKLPKEGPLLLGIEGLSNTGKSILAEKLGKKLAAEDYNPKIVEGDLFHYGAEVAMKIYEKLSEEIKNGGRTPKDFPELIWNYGKMDEQLISPIIDFRNSKEGKMELLLKGVLKGKKNGTEHDIKYEIDNNSIIIVPSMYLRQLRFDLFFYLTADENETVQRKINRGRADGKERDPALTRSMVVDIEKPAMEEYLSKHPTRNEITIETTDFESISVLDKRR